MIGTPIRVHMDLVFSPFYRMFSQTLANYYPGINQSNENINVNDKNDDPVIQLFDEFYIGKTCKDII